MIKNEVQYVSVKTGDPSALGLFGLAMVTLVASTQKLGVTEGFAYVIPWAIFLGAFAQLMASVLDFKKENLFGGTAFGAYAFFWMAVATSWLMKLGFFGEALMNNIDTKQLGYAFLGYLIFSIFMTIGATQTNKALFFIFVLIDFLFIGLSFSTLGIMPVIMHEVAAISELLIAILSFYLAGANVINHQFKRVVMPIGAPFGNKKK
ncbi:MAG: acetate uptake transporter [Clostridiales bacterium]|nr:acetate uptake transporter [Clostridiales bacterium]